MRTYNWTKGKKEIKKYKEISNISQGVYGKDEVMQVFSTDDASKHKSEWYDSRIEEVKD
jgi:hypothetical protein